MGRLRSLIVLVPVLLAACGDQGPDAPAALVLTPTIPRVPMGGTLQLDAAVVNADGQALEDARIAFASSEPEVVTVDDGGLLTSVGSLDTVTVTASSGDLTASVEALVVPPPSSFLVIPRSLTLAAGETAQLYVIVTDEQGDSVPEPGLVVETDNAPVAWAGPGGGVQAGQSGLATLVFRYGEDVIDVSVTVTP